MTIELLDEAQTTQYHCERFEYEHSGTMQVPKAGTDGEDSFICKMHSSFKWVCISWTAEKWGEPPVVPSATTLDSNATFIEGWRSAALPIVDDSVKGRFWRMSGQYLYALTEDTGLAGHMPTGAPPFDTIRSAADNTIPSSYFDTGILGVP